LAIFSEAGASIAQTPVGIIFWWRSLHLATDGTITITIISGQRDTASTGGKSI
jgi:hypothetical protein